MPRYDDEEPGLSFFRTFLGEGDDFSNLTIPRTFISRTEVNDAAFRNTDLSQSCMCWNDFVEVGFRGADLSGADLRRSTFRKVRFSASSLRGADLRHSSFEDCDFEGADLAGAVLSRSQKTSLGLTPEQSKVVDWRWRSGPEPDGG